LGYFISFSLLILDGFQCHFVDFSLFADFPGISDGTSKKMTVHLPITPTAELVGTPARILMLTDYEYSVPPAVHSFSYRLINNNLTHLTYDVSFALDGTLSFATAYHIVYNENSSKSHFLFIYFSRQA
jgi:hypothetical protein